MHYQDRTVSTLFHISFTGSIHIFKGAIIPRDDWEASNHSPAPCGLLPGVCRLDLALARRLHTTIGKLHARSAHDLRFPWTLDLTGCSDVVVLEFRHRRWIRRRWRLCEPRRLPCQHRPLHVQTRLAQPPAPPLVRSTKDSKCSAHQMDPTLFLYNGLTGGPSLLSLVLGPSKGL